MPPGTGGPVTRMRGVWGLLRNPTAYLERCRAAWGDTFVVDVAGHRLLCLFSAQGIRGLYGFAEHEASFGLATFELIRRKVPDELFAGRRNTPHDLFGRQETERYLGNLEEAVAIEIDALGPRGYFEVFAECRRLGHRLGLGSWAGVEALPHRFGGTEYRYGRKELGHVHGDRLADLPLPRKLARPTSAEACCS